MIQGLYVSLGGGVVESRQMEIIANNLANVNTIGFKRDLGILKDKFNIRHELGLAKSTSNPLLDKIGDGVLFTKTSTMQEQGRLEQTTNELDLAIQGRGFFAVQRFEGGEEKRYYTRAGNFTIDREGFIVVDDSEFAMEDNQIHRIRTRLLDDAGNPIRIYDEESVGEKIKIQHDGRILLDIPGTGAIGDVARIGLHDFDNGDSGLKKVGKNLYEYFGKDEDSHRFESTATIRQGFREASNVDGIAEMARMIETMRKYEANMKFVTFQDQTLSRACNDLGRAPA